MRYRDGRRSICLSSQSGCPLTCTFCATGAMRFGRNLTASEIVDQALHFRRSEPVNHAVYMGMGEPFLNFDDVLASARRLPDMGITPRRTTISTVGWMPGLRRFVDEIDQPIRLALSIHAADASKRSELMPVNDRYPLPDVLAECRRYVELRRRKVFVEYVMLAGVNDSGDDARALAALLDGRSFKVNLIPYNPTGGKGGARFEGSGREAIERFKSVLVALASRPPFASHVGVTSRRRVGSWPPRSDTGARVRARPMPLLRSAGRPRRRRSSEVGRGRRSALFLSGGSVSSSVTRRPCEHSNCRRPSPTCSGLTSTCPTPCRCRWRRRRPPRTRSCRRARCR